MPGILWAEMSLRLFRDETRSPLRRALAVALLALPACVVKFTDRYSPIPNGGVTGPAADCSQVTPLPAEGAPAGDPRVRLIGRFADPVQTEIPVCDPTTLKPTDDVTVVPARPFEYSGTQIQFRFTGKNALVNIHLPPRAPVTDRVSGQPAFDPGDIMLFTLVVDDLPPVLFKVVPCNPVYSVASLLAKAGRPFAPGEHTVTVHRNSEALFGPAFFYDVAIEEGQLLPPIVRPRRIEIIGDSISCGYGILGLTATCPFSPATEDNYSAYGSLAARMLGAEVTTECWSGKGVYQNYSDEKFPDEPTDTPEQKKLKAERRAAAPGELMPLLWTRTLPSRGPLTLPEAPEIKWDFTKQDQPQVVVVNLGTNDVTRDDNFDNVPDGFDPVPYKDKFEVFLKDVRSKYKDAHVFVALSPMVSDQFPFPDARGIMRTSTRELVERLNAAGDAKMYFMELVEQGFRYGLGCDYHPSLEVHRIMAEQVAGAIRSKLCW